MSQRPDPGSLPCSPSEAVAGVLYFPRLTAKIRLHHEGRLWEELHANLGKGVDHWCSSFLHVDYAALKERVLQGDSDEEILAWCEQTGRTLNETDKLVWKNFVLKLGLEDKAAGLLAKLKAESGLESRDDIQTMGHFIDVHEGRKP